MYWSVRMMVSPPKSHQRLCMSESRYGWGVLGTTPRCVCVGADLQARGCVFVAASLLAYGRGYSSTVEGTRTEMALMSGSSLSPRLCTPAKLPASRHRPAHGFVNSISTTSTNSGGS